MPNWDFSGARGSGLGDDFHEVWALRRALDLLLPDNELAALTVEGMLPEDEKGQPSDTWDGVDCTFYFGQESIEHASKIVIDQLKYSGSSPRTNWTVSRLTYSTAKNTNNSTIRKLANAFAAIDRMRPSLHDNDSLVVRLISNQSISKAVLRVISNPTKVCDEQKRLFDASGLSKKQFSRFCAALDFSLCGTSDLMSLEEGAIRSIAEWTGDNARDIRDLLLKKVRNLMRPDEKRAAIRKETVASWLGYADPNSLFPCRSSISKPRNLVRRTEVESVANELVAGEQFICIHGIGGCGKTTALFELEDMLPNGSKIIVYDCYGSGKYLNSNAFRHRKDDAFLQLSNELASQCGMPAFLAGAVRDYARAFHSQIVRASQLLSRQSPEAVLVIAVDAADNSVWAAEHRKETDKCFVPDFVALGDLPSNVRLIISGRSGRLHDLRLPTRYKLFELCGFTQTETSEFVSGKFGTAPSEWVEDFHHLSSGNPRVQDYALQFGNDNLEQTLDYLRPTGKGLAQVFREQFEFALTKSGNADAMSEFCAALIELPRPIPIDDLAAVSEMGISQIRDMCSDLAPGLHLFDNHISFADEDFEHFVGSDASGDRTAVRSRIVHRFSLLHQSNPYAAENYGQALVAADQGADLIALIKTESEPPAIKDPAQRRRVQRQRLRLALRICRENNDTADAITTILIAAEALKTDHAIERIIEENIDLAVAFSADELDRVIFRDPENLKHQGPALCYSFAQAAREKDWVQARELRRQIRSWLDHRHQYHEELKAEEHYRHHEEWSIPQSAFSAILEARLRSDGWESALSLALRWHPRSWALGAVLVLLKRLHATNETELLVELESIVSTINTPWRFAVEVYACLSDKDRVPLNLTGDLLKLAQRGHLSGIDLDEFGRGQQVNAEFVDLIITGCECVAARSENPMAIVPVLEELAKPENRQREYLYAHQTTKLDALLRAWTLKEALQHGNVDPKLFLIEPSEDGTSTEDPEQPPRAKRRIAETERELSEYVSEIAPFYVARSNYICSKASRTDNLENLSASVKNLGPDNYRLRRTSYSAKMRQRCARSTARLLSVADCDQSQIFNLAFQIVHATYFAESHAALAGDFAMAQSLHADIVRVTNERAQSIRSERANADDKVSALLSLARALETISIDDARGLFSEAIEVAAEIDENVVHELMIFDTLTGSSLVEMNQQDRREAAISLAIVASDASVRLSGHDGFPWESVCRSVAKLDMSVALACSSRWDDEGTVSRGTTLHEITSQGFADGTVTAPQFLSLLPLYSHLEATTLIQVLEKVEPSLKSVVESEIARHEMAGGGKPRKEVIDQLGKEAPSGNWSFWTTQAQETVRFLDEERIRAIDKIAPSSAMPNERKRANKTSNEKFDFSTCDVTRPESLESTWSAYQVHVRASDGYPSLGAFLKHIRPSSPRNRIGYLDALAKLDMDYIDTRDLLTEIQLCIVDWGNTPAIKTWCNHQLPNVIVDHFLSASAYIHHNDSRLPELLAAAGLRKSEAQELVLAAIEHHADDLGAPRLFHLVRFVGQFVDAASAARVTKDYSLRLRERIEPNDQDKWLVEEIPGDVCVAFGRLIFAYLSDIELGNRWLAAHVLRIACRISESNLLVNVLDCYGRQADPVFRDPNAPFYWLSARLWLLIALDRIASETPASLSEQADFLFAQATGTELPHALMRDYAKSAAHKLITLSKAIYSEKQIAELRAVNTSTFPAIAQDTYESDPPRSAEKRDWKERRFHFDEMDTLSYWYQSATEIFANLPYERFTIQAEKWIVDKWGVTDEVWRWDDEKRRRRIGEGMNTLHSHGSLPAAERYNTHLEWHAMWCAIGDLLSTHPLRRNAHEVESYGTLKYKLERHGLSFPPFWLSDLKGPKPLEHRFWFPPAADRDGVSKWLEEIEEEDFLLEAGLQNGDFVVVDASHDTHADNFGVRVNIRSAIVEPKTAGALCRSLQSCESSWDFHLPHEDTDSEIDKGGYRLKGFLQYSHDDLCFDRFDPLRFSVGRTDTIPGRDITSHFGLNRTDGPISSWITEREEIIFRRIAWGETPNNSDEYYRRYETAFRSDGHQICMSRTSLREYLNSAEMDLVLEVEVERRDRGYESSGYDSEKKEFAFDRIYLLRRSGVIETANGRVGTWAINH